MKKLYVVVPTYAASTCVGYWDRGEVDNKTVGGGMGEVVEYVELVELIALREENAKLRSEAGNLKEFADEIKRLREGCFESEYLSERSRNKTLKAQLADAALIFDRIVALTHSWVIAEQTVDCKHTYDAIRAMAASAFLAKHKETV